MKNLGYYNGKYDEIENMVIPMNDRASYFGRVFARCGGLSTAVEQALKEHGVTEEDFVLKAISCSGLAECNAALLKASRGKLEENGFKILEANQSEGWFSFVCM